MTNTDEQGDQKLRIAGIEAKTAIAVAFVGAMASVGTVFVTKYLDSDRLSAAEWKAEAPQQHWLRIRAIEGPAGTRVRLMAHVDDVTFSYPTHTTWAETGQALTEGRFPLPLGDGSHRLRFSAETPGPGVTVYVSQETVLRRASSEVMRYTLLPVATGGDGGWSAGTTRGVGIAPPLSVQYAITVD